MKLRLNGESVESQAPTVAQLLQERHISPVGVAVAVNETIVRRAHHATHLLTEGDRIEIIRAVQGG